MVPSIQEKAHTLTTYKLDFLKCAQLTHPYTAQTATGLPPTFID